MDLKREERSLEHFGKIAFTGFGVVIALGMLAIIYLIFEKMVLSGERPFPGLLLIAFIVFAGLSFGYVIWNEHLKEKRAKLQATPAYVANDKARSTAELSDGVDFKPVPTVIEDTTKLLKLPRK